MQVELFPLGPIGTNCYLVGDDSWSKAIVIDPGVHPEPLLERIKNIEIEAILLTHAHFDHIGGVEALRKLKNCPVYLHPAEKDWLSDPMKNGSGLWDGAGGAISTAPAEFELHHGDRLTFIGESFSVLHTPGHSPGGVSFYVNSYCFSGDALFADTIGRTDLPGGDFDQLIESIQTHLFPLPDETRVYPGHGHSTTIGKEKRENPYAAMK